MIFFFRIRYHIMAPNSHQDFRQDLFSKHICTYFFNQDLIDSGSNFRKMFFECTIYLGAPLCPLRPYISPINTHPKVTHLRKILRKKKNK